jgi:SAM-dependent methyltransferase
VVEALPTLRRDFEALKRRQEDDRSPERIRAHYQLERRLAERLREAPAHMRAKVYSDVYAELFETLPDHPQKAATPHVGRARREASLLNGFLDEGTAYLELGCGDAVVCFEVAAGVSIAYGLDVTDVLIQHDRAPPNFQFVRTDGVNIPLPSDSLDFAYSNQLMEHLHPEDAEAQLRDICRVLKPGARYLCVTPNRLTGPHDVSKFFDYEARGFHLREYDHRSLRKLGLAAGFRRVEFHVMLRGGRAPLPFWVAAALEWVLDASPANWRARLSRFRPLEVIMGINAVMHR